MTEKMAEMFQPEFLCWISGHLMGMSPTSSHLFDAASLSRAGCSSGWRCKHVSTTDTIAIVW